MSNDIRSGDAGIVLGRVPTEADAGKIVGIGPNGEFVYGDMPTSIVDPNNPAAFQTIQAAIDAAETSGVNTVIQIAPGNYPENPVISTAPGYLELRAIAEAVTIDGTLTWTVTNADEYLVLTDTYITGDIAASAASGNAYLWVNNGFYDGAITCTGAGKIHVTASSPSPGLSGQNNSYIAGNITSTGKQSFAGFWLYGALSSGDAEISFINCGTAIPTITFVGTAGKVLADGWSLTSMLTLGVPAITNGVVKAVNGNITRSRLNQGNNLPAFDVIADPQAGLYRVDIALIVKTVGTAGTIQPNVIFTDDLGNPTVAVGTGLNITGTGRVQGSYVFRSNAGANIQASVTGVVTPGTLNYDLEVSVTALGNE